MTSKEKAIELVDMMSNQTYKYQEYAGARYTTCEIGYEGGKKCALIAVDEILKCEATEPSDTDWDDCGATAQYYWPQKKVDAGKFWGEVKQEIENL
jgi:hypothetical protein